MLNSQKLRTKSEEFRTVIRKTQPVFGSESTILILPKKQIEKIGIKRGNYVKISIYNGNALLVEKVDDSDLDKEMDS